MGMSHDLRCKRIARGLFEGPCNILTEDVKLEDGIFFIQGRGGGEQFSTR